MTIRHAYSPIRSTLCLVAFAGAAALPAFAQTTTESTSGATTPAVTSATAAPRDDREDHSKWGWIGLLGLAGLAGLRRRPDETGTTSTRTAAQR